MKRHAWILAMEDAWRKDRTDEPPSAFIEALADHVTGIQPVPPKRPPPMPAPYPNSTREQPSRGEEIAYRALMGVYALVIVGGLIAIGIAILRAGR